MRALSIGRPRYHKTLRDCQCPLLAQSGHPFLHRTVCFRPKATAVRPEPTPSRARARIATIACL